MAIPKVIHQIWFQGENNIPEKYHEYCKSWRELNPTYKFSTWDETSIKQLLEHNPQFKSTYEAYDLMIQKIDFIKYVILYLYGGIYVDVDILCFKSIDPLFSKDKDLIVCQAPYDFLNRVFMAVAMHDPTKKLINNGIIAAIPKEPHVKKILDYCEKNQQTIWKKINTPIYIFRTTGPIIFTAAIMSEGITDRVEILNRSVFESYNRFNKTCPPPADAYGLHVYELSWLGDLYKWLLDHF